MRIELYNSIPEMDGAPVVDAAALVIDVLRATSTLTEALANGARAVYPVLTAEEAVRIANSLGREDTIVCGERKGLLIEGFDLGNSPREFTPDRVRDRKLVMTTTNGTRAFLAVAEAERVVAASFLNLSAAAEAVADAERVVILCAGKEDRFTLDDTLCGGHLVAKLTEGREAACSLNDGALAAQALASAQPPTEELFTRIAAGQALVEVGLGEDLPFCAQVDRHTLVPVMVDRVIRPRD